MAFLCLVMILSPLEFSFLVTHILLWICLLRRVIALYGRLQRMSNLYIAVGGRR